MPLCHNRISIICYCLSRGTVRYGADSEFFNDIVILDVLGLGAKKGFGP